MAAGVVRWSEWAATRASAGRRAYTARVGRGLGHANLGRFSGPVTTGLPAELVRMGRQDFGSFTVGEVELVRTDRLLSPAGTTTLARLPLAGRPG